MNENNEHEDYLEKFLTNTESDITEIKKDIHTLNNKLESKSNSSLEYINVQIDMLPCGAFYKNGTKIKIRAANVEEVQNFSVVEENNPIDATDKMNEMLQCCVKYFTPNGNLGSYKSIKDSDRLYLIFMIRELTFQKGNSLAKDIDCPHCKAEVKIPFRATTGASQPKTFVNSEMSTKLLKYFDKDTKLFKIVINGVQWKLSPPSIGLQEVFFTEIKSRHNADKKNNVSFLKIVPFLLYDKDSISADGIKAKELEFKSMDLTTFQALDSMVNLMLFGIKELKMDCYECGNEVRTPFTFPYRAADLFVIPDAFTEFDSE